MTPALAARVRQLAAQAEHRRAIAEFRARHAADQQARVNTLLLEAVAALAGLLTAPASQARQHAARPCRSDPRAARAADHGATATPLSTTRPRRPRRRGLPSTLYMPTQSGAIMPHPKRRRTPPAR